MENSKRLFHRKQSHLLNSRCFRHFASGYEMKTHRIMLQKRALFLNQYTSVTGDYFKSIYIWWKGCRFPHLIWSVNSFCFDFLLSHFPNSHLMLPELEVCPCSYLSDPRLSRPLACPSPFLLQAHSFPYTSLNVRNMFSAPTASSFCMYIPLLPTCCWLWKRNKSQHERMCRALYSSRGVNLSKSPALAKAFFPLQCQCCSAARGPPCAGTGSWDPEAGRALFLSCHSLLLYAQWPPKHHCLQSIHSLVGNYGTCWS